MTPRIVGSINALGPEFGRFALWGDGPLIGYLNCSLTERGLGITDVFVEPEYRHRGYGKMLVERFESAARESGFVEVRLGSWIESPEAEAFWKHIGYEGHYHDGCGNCGFRKRLE